MIHICTVHWKDDRWVDVQLDYLRRHIHGPYRVYGWLNDLPQDHRDKFFYSTTEPVPQHGIKLNLLADVVKYAAPSPDDIIIFLDGDAFPIAPLEEKLDEWLSEAPLAAIQRREQYEDIIPHPAFCATTVAFWNEIGGDWKPGYRWKNSVGDMVTDPGANLLKILRDRDVQWRPLLRSNRTNKHPLLFGIYADTIYHHCAGFRRPRTVYEVKEAFLEDQGAIARWFWTRYNKFFFRGGRSKIIAKRLSIFLPGKKRAVAITDRNAELSEDIYRQLTTDPEFFRQFQ